MDNSNGSANTGTGKASASQVEPNPDPERQNRKRKNVSAECSGEVETGVPTAKRRDVRRRRKPPSTVVPTSASSNLPSSSAILGTSVELPPGAAPAPGLSMPSISSSEKSSLGSSNSKTDVCGFTSDTQGSSECFTEVIEFDYNLDSPVMINSNVLSPPSDATLGDVKENREFLGKRNLLRHREDGTKKVNSCYLTPSYKQQNCPLPEFSWVKRQEMWSMMCRKDDLAWLDREPSMFDNHPGLQPRMRSILLDWLNEVCEVYKLHRETFYLAMDYVDRYLSRRKEMKKTHLQLLGITALFIAAKVEEIYPPKIGEFAYVTDGACTAEDILQEELLVLCDLDWNVNPVTAIGWLGLYMQTNVSHRDMNMSQVRHSRTESVGNSPYSNQKDKRLKVSDENATSPQQALGKKPAASKINDAFMYPQFSGMEYAHTAQLIDLCSLDMGMTNFKYSVIAAAAVSHTFDRKTATRVSGLNWEDIAPCAKWMEPFFQVICEVNATYPLTFLESNESLKFSNGLNHVCPNLVADNSHIIQTHTTSLEMLDLVSIKIEEMESSMRMGLLEASPAPGGIEPEGGMLTPPASNRKSLEAVGGVITTVSSLASESITAELS
ncbi:G1/S-specific cyclin-E [Anopheles nili]|uniref:G1/S-specific cyclin-E n=1 Tax=Anopheles nili TaxID=185578 RepID=UPI00237A1A73|nr:G1/S-specific cyclin-E [Anopheles nili]